MYFFERNKEFKDNIICIDDSGREYTYLQIWDMGDELTSNKRERELVLLQCSNDVESLASYLALLRKRCPVILMGRDVEQTLVEGIRQKYRPDEKPEKDAAEIYPELGLLLSTSGSTGAQKLVRLSYDNIQANCDSIVEYLGLTADERPITTLPMEYTYGLSVIHSHVAVGASIILTNRTFFNPEFWDMIKDLKATSMAGVPYSYEMLFNRLQLDSMDLPCLKTMTQAGGHLNPELQERVGKWAAETGRRFFVMYGQTEATARMSYIPPERCLEKIGSIGLPVPGGRIELSEDGEMIYYGPNVSLGYATCREDLAKSDDNNGRLETGDIAYRDEEGYLYISGRKKRFIKLQGKRISLDQIQEVLQEEFESDEIACTGIDDIGVSVWTSISTGTDVAFAGGDKTFTDKINEIFRDKWGIRQRLVFIKQIKKIPRNTSGKILYKDLKEEGVCSTENSEQ